MQLSTNFAESGTAIVLIGGGGAGPEHHLAHIFSRLLQLAGGLDAKVVILTSATGYPQRQAIRTGNFFRTLGVENLHAPMINTRAEADDPDNEAILRAADAIYLTGGDQSRYVNILEGTRCGQAIHEASRNGIILGGTSAGAAVMSDVMIASSFDWIMQRRGVPLVRHGMGLLGHGVTVDTHFAQRRRIPRLLKTVQTLPGTLGIGLDEDTALIVDHQGIGEVIGYSQVYFFRQRGNRLQQYTLVEGQCFDLVNFRIKATPRRDDYQDNYRGEAAS